MTKDASFEEVQAAKRAQDMKNPAVKKQLDFLKKHNEAHEKQVEAETKAYNERHSARELSQATHVTLPGQENPGGEGHVEEEHEDEAESGEEAVVTGEEQKTVPAKKTAAPWDKK